MNIFINNEQREIHPSISLENLLYELKISGTRGMAIAVNQEVIPKSQWVDHFVKENDKITIIRATQGG